LLEKARCYREVEPTLDSANWPCEYATAQKVKLRLPLEAPPPHPPKSDVLFAEADLKPNEIQDLADRLSDIRKAAVISISSSTCVWNSTAAGYRRGGKL
jgi:hypothetical protein